MNLKIPKRNLINRIGIFGGTFDPVHLAHTHFANEFIEKIKLDMLYVVPTNVSPFKIDGAHNFAPANMRLAMLNIAFSNNKKIRISKYEINKNSISYTYNTVRYYSKRFPNSNLYLLIGSDQAVEFKKWRNWEYILDKTQLVIAMRNEKNKIYDINKINTELVFDNKKPIWLEPFEYSLSSTEIRELIKNGQEWKHLVPEKVHNFIINQGLYKASCL